jgi:two-component system sensor histidine kinase HupT/HoxJ
MPHGWNAISPPSMATCRAGEREPCAANLRIDRLLDDLPSLIDGTVEGAERTRDIVDALKRFSATDRDERRAFDLVEVIERAVQWVARPRRTSSRSASTFRRARGGRIARAGAAGGDEPGAERRRCHGKRRERRLEITGASKDGRRVIEFRDSGPGIPAEQPRQAVRSLLHHQAGRARHRPRPGDQLRHRRAPWRQIAAGNHPRGGALFTLRLPLA